MGKGGISQESHGEEGNVAAWLLGVNNLKIQPFKLPSLGTSMFSFAFQAMLRAQIRIQIWPESSVARESPVVL